MMILLLVVSMSLLVVKFYVSVPAHINNLGSRIQDRTNNEFLNAVSAGRGILLVSMADRYYQPLTWAQLTTRRPILLNPDKIDILIYTPVMGPQVDMILKEIYGVELSNPPRSAAQMDGYPMKLNKAVWEKRTIEQWRDIRKKFNVTEIWTFSNWNLQLPVRAKKDTYVLYEIPLS